MAEGSAAGASAGDPGFMGFLPLIIIFALFYFLLIRPQSKKAKQHRAMVDALAKGDEVVTNGGLLGKATKVDEGFVSVEIADGVVVQVQKQSVATIVPKGTYKSKSKD
ncbi:MAG: preprotein translocase subunit YajC [Thiohalomonadales bacterium]